MSLHNNPKISIIVPVYNAEKYLHRCIDSILNQTFTDFEVLLINDGSTDSSGSICDEYAKKDSRVRVFHKENGGVSSARQLGIEHCKGEYSIHIDSDDWIEPEMLELLIDEVKSQDVDIVCFDYFKDSKSISIQVRNKPTGTTGYSLYKDLMLHNLPGSCCNKMIKHSLYTQNNIKFPQGINFGEDWYVNVLTSYYSKKISYVNKALYHYVQNDDSIIHNLSKQCFINRFYAVDKVSSQLNLNKLDPYYLHYCFVLKIECYNSKLFSLEELNKLTSQIEKYINHAPTLPLKYKLILNAMRNNNLFILWLYDFLKKIKNNV